MSSQFSLEYFGRVESLSYSFVVYDTTIVYAFPTFCHLREHSEEEVFGRFLVSPAGNIAKGRP